MAIAEVAGRWEIGSLSMCRGLTYVTRRSVDGELTVHYTICSGELGIYETMLFPNRYPPSHASSSFSTLWILVVAHRADSPGG